MTTKTVAKWKPSKTVTCINCGLVVERERTYQLYCSYRCMTEHHAQKAISKTKIYERDGYICAYCGVDLLSYCAQQIGLKPHADHINPRSKGGEDKAYNIVTACSKCNQQKKNKTLLDVRRVLAQVEIRNIQSGIEPQAYVIFSGVGAQFVYLKKLKQKLLQSHAPSQGEEDKRDE